jgi:hypothetical protein
MLQGHLNCYAVSAKPMVVLQPGAPSASRSGDAARTRASLGGALTPGPAGGNETRAATGNVGLTSHDLRGSAVTRLASWGTEAKIASITGQKLKA